MCSSTPNIKCQSMSTAHIDVCRDYWKDVLGLFGLKAKLLQMCKYKAYAHFTYKK